MNPIDDIFDMLGTAGRNIFTEKEIDEARKRQQKMGGTFLDNLSQLTGRPAPTGSPAGLDLDELNRQIRADFGVTPMMPSERSSRTESSDGTAARAAEPEKEPEKKATVADFRGVAEAVSGKVFGQEALLKALVVAFKRPWILPEEAGHARNVIYLTGPDDTGRHTALNAVVGELAQRGLVSTPRIHTMDLSVYKSPDSENIFLQDLYAALSSPAQVLVFENFNACHNACCPYLSDLVTKGSCRLNGRYLLQKGQLVGITNSFVSEAVDSFSAAGKYLVFISTGKIGKLADVFGAPMVNAVGDICTSEPLTEESWRKMAQLRWQDLQQTAKERLSFRLTADEELILSEAAAATQRGAGTAGLLNYFDKLRLSLAALRLEQDLPEDTELVLTAGEGSLMAQAGEASFRLADLISGGYTGQIEAVKKELDGIVGLKQVKEYILSLEEYHAVRKRRMEAGMKASEVSKHMVFTGNPGTGKTTIARIVSRYLKAIGVLSGGQLVEVSRADLVGRFVGHTAPLTNQVIQSALGGVLFIDEAYSLYRGKDDSFGLEAIDTLVKGMEDHRDDLIVILAGYTKEMHQFLEANSGLKSRFPNWIDFPDYTAEELLQIAQINATSKGYRIEAEANIALLAYFAAVQAKDAAQAGNGRLVRNKLEEAILNQSRRLAAEPEAELDLLLLSDFELE